VRSRGRLCGAVLVHPVSADLPARVLPWRNGPSAAVTSVAGGAGPDAVRHEERYFLPAWHCRAEGRYRKPEASGADMVQVRRAYPRADACWLLSAHASLNPRNVAGLKRAQRQPAGRPCEHVPLGDASVCRRYRLDGPCRPTVVPAVARLRDYRWLRPVLCRPLSPARTASGPHPSTDHCSKAGKHRPEPARARTAPPEFSTSWCPGRRHGRRA
jgi:hypothetical protein